MNNTEKEKEIIKSLAELLWSHREASESKLDAKSIGWIDDDVAHLEIGFLKNDPESDYENELVEEGYSIDFTEALSIAFARLKNSGYGEE